MRIGRKTMPRKRQAKSKKSSVAVVVRQQPGPKQVPKLYKTPSRPRVTKDMVERVCSVLDPFCEAARGSKVMDGGHTRTIPYTFHYRQVLSTTASGAATSLWLPGFGLNPNMGGTLSSGSIYTFSGAIPTVTMLTNTGVGSVRMVSAGVIIKRISAPLYASGMLRIRAFGNTNGVSFASMDLGTYSCTRSLDIPFQDCSELAVVLNKFNPMKADALINPLDYLGSAGAVNDYTGTGFEQLSIFLEGGPASVSALDLEYFMHFEIVLDDGNSLQLLATPTAPYNPVVKAAVEELQSTATSLFKTGVKAAGNYMVKAAAKALTRAIGGPVGNAAMALVEVN